MIRSSTDRRLLQSQIHKSNHLKSKHWQLVPTKKQFDLSLKYLPKKELFLLGFAICSFHPSPSLAGYLRHPVEQVFVSYNIMNGRPRCLFWQDWDTKFLPKNGVKTNSNQHLMSRFNSSQKPIKLFAWATLWAGLVAPDRSLSSHSTVIITQI